MTTDRHPLDLTAEEVDALRLLLASIDTIDTPASLDSTTAACQALRKAIDGTARPITGETSDGYHTFNELYEHRHALFIGLCRQLDLTQRILNQRIVTPWRSRLHSDGTMFDGWFVMGIGTEAGDQITYHLPVSLWDATDFVHELPRAPEFDGHTSADVLQRLRRYW